MRLISTILSLLIMCSVVGAPLAHALTIGTDSAYTSDSKVKKYDTQLAKLRADILILQQKYVDISKLRNERISVLASSTSIKNTKGVATTKLATSKKLEEFPSTDTTWRTRFLPTGTPPLNSFKAYYFNTSQPTKVVATAQAASIDINYSWEAGPGFNIVSEDFGGYWIGDFVLTKDEEMVLDISQGRSETRVIIDKRLVYKGESNESVKIHVPKGRHTLEVEYVNNWHTVEFSASLRSVTDVPKSISTSEIKNIEHKEVWYAGVYESGATNKTIKLVPKGDSSTSKILFLSSYSSVKWDASLLKKTGIKAIVYSSYDPGAQVMNVPEGIVVYTGTLPYGYTLKASCPTNDRMGLMGCEGIDKFTEVYGGITKLTTKSLTGFAGEYSPTELLLPGTVLTKTLIMEALAHPSKLRAESAKFIESQKIDNIF